MPSTPAAASLPTVHPPAGIGARDLAGWLAGAQPVAIGARVLADADLAGNPFTDAVFELPMAARALRGQLRCVVHVDTDCPSPVGTVDASGLPGNATLAWCNECHPLWRSAVSRLDQVWLRAAEGIGAAVIMTHARDLLLTHWQGGSYLTVDDVVHVLTAVISEYETNPLTRRARRVVDENGQLMHVQFMLGQIRRSGALEPAGESALNALLELAQAYQPQAVAAYRQVMDAVPLLTLRPDFLPLPEREPAEPERAWVLVRTSQSWNLAHHPMVREWRIALSAANTVAGNEFLHLVELPWQAAVALFTGRGHDPERWSCPFAPLSGTGAGQVLLEVLAAGRTVPTETELAKAVAAVAAAVAH